MRSRGSTRCRSVARRSGGNGASAQARGDSFGKTYHEAVNNAGLPVIVFGTADVAAEVERLKGRGVRFRNDLEKPEWGLTNLFEDSFSNLIMLFETPRSEG